MAKENTPAAEAVDQTAAKVPSLAEFEAMKAQLAAMAAQMEASKSTPASLSDEQLSAEAQARTDRMRTKALLDAQPKRKIRLRQAPNGQPKLPDAFVGVNGHNFQLQRGIDIDVPETVFELLYEAGEI
jgi:hypothetical protein